MRGSHDYMEMQEQNHAAQTRILELEKRISTLETDNDKLEAAIQRSGRNDSQHEYLQNLQIQVKELENQVQMMKDEKQEAREMVFKEKNEEIRSQKSEIDLLRMQVRLQEPDRFSSII